MFVQSVNKKGARAQICSLVSFFYFSNDIIKKMKMKIIRKISGLFLAFMLLFAVLFVIAPQEEVKADVVANNITSIDDLKGTVWNLKEDVSNITFNSECWLYFTKKGNTSPYTYRTDNSLITNKLGIQFNEEIEGLTFSESVIAGGTNTSIFSNGVYNSNYGTFPRRLIFNDWNSFSFVFGDETLFIEYLNKIAVQQITDVNELKGTSWKLRQDITNIQIGSSGYVFGYSDNSICATVFAEEEELEINGLIVGFDSSEMLLIVGYEMGTEQIQAPLYNNEYLVNNAILTFNNSENELIVVDLVELNNGQASYLTWYESFTIFFEQIPTNIITIIDNVNNTSYEIEYQEGYTLEANNIYLNALEYQEVEANSPFNNFVNVYKKLTGWSMISLSGFPRSIDITFPFTFTSQYSGEDWLLLPQYEDIDYIPFNLIVNNVREGVDHEEVLIWGAIPVINNEVVINNNMLAYLNYSLIIGAEVTDAEAPPTINYRANVLFNNLELNNNQIILSSDVNSSNIIAVELTYLSNAIISANGSITGENVVSYYKNYNISGNYTDTINIADRTTNAYIQIRIAVRNNMPVDTGDINIKSAFTTFFSLVGGFLSMKLGFITLGEIIGLVLAIALLGFIFKVWNGGNNG